MKRFAQGDWEVWAGAHRSMGMVLFDPRAQLGVPANRVRLYVSAQKRMATFDRGIARDRLAGQTGGDLEGAARAYFKLRGRFTHCYNCKRDLNSIDFDVCQRCGWITCTCRACGCSFHSKP